MMSRCIGLNKHNKKCRRKIAKGNFFCCESHKPLNKREKECLCVLKK